MPGRSSPLGVGGITGCESEAALADSVSHTSFPLSLLFGGGSADIEEHNRPSKVVLAALLPTKRPPLTAFSFPSHRTDGPGRSDCGQRRPCTDLRTGRTQNFADRRASSKVSKSPIGRIEALTLDRRHCLKSLYIETPIPSIAIPLRWHFDSPSPPSPPTPALPSISISAAR